MAFWLCPISETTEGGILRKRCDLFQSCTLEWQKFFAVETAAVCPAGGSGGCGPAQGIQENRLKGARDVHGAKNAEDFFCPELIFFRGTASGDPRAIQARPPGHR